MEQLSAETPKNESKESTFSQGNLYINESINIPVRVKVKDGQIQGIENESNDPQTDNITKDCVLIDEVNLNAIKDFFAQANVLVEGTPWTVEDQEDFLGDISIPCSELNYAISTGKVVLEKDETDPEYINVVGLDYFIDQYINKHYAKI